MLKQLSALISIGTLSLTAACGSEAPEPGIDTVEYPEGFPFVTRAVVVSDLCVGTSAAQGCILAEDPPRGATVASISAPEPGKVCAKGNVGAGGWVFLVLSFTEYGPTGTPNVDEVLSTLDADARGIKAVSFRLEGPTDGGHVVTASTIARETCAPPHFECRLGGFMLMDPETADPVIIKTEGMIEGEFEDFVQVVPEQSQAFDTSVLDGIYVNVNDPGPFEVCVSDFALLDADGNEVAP